MTDNTHPSRQPVQRRAKEKSVQFRVDDTQLDALERAAEREGESLANWCRRNLLKLASWHPPSTTAQH